jgi:DNA-binding GntR family transcriptional regulator
VPAMLHASSGAPRSAFVPWGSRGKSSASAALQRLLTRIGLGFCSSLELACELARLSQRRTTFVPKQRRQTHESAAQKGNRRKMRGTFTQICLHTLVRVRLISAACRDILQHRGLLNASTNGQRVCRRTRRTRKIRILASRKQGRAEMSDPQVSLSHNVYRLLKRDILECRLLPDAELREQSLAHRFIVSKSPVREALLRLEQERLITVAPRQGYRVAALSVEDASEVFGLRKVLESACADAASANAPSHLLSGLDRFRSLSVVEGQDPTDAFIEYNRSFHSAICALCGSARLARMTIDLIDQMERMIRLSVNSVPLGGRDVLLREHGQIIDAIQSGSPRKAARLTREHISGAERRVVSGLSRTAVRN